jgi:hypothetical protein
MVQVLVSSLEFKSQYYKERKKIKSQEYTLELKPSPNCSPNSILWYKTASPRGRSTFLLLTQEYHWASPIPSELYHLKGGTAI